MPFQVASTVMQCTWFSLALLYLASWASGNITWPTDSQLRASFLLTRGLPLYGDDNLDKLAKMEARSMSALVLGRIAATACCCQEGRSENYDLSASSVAYMQGITWLHDYTFFGNPELVQACVQAGVESMPMIVRTLHCLTTPACPPSC